MHLLDTLMLAAVAQAQPAPAVQVATASVATKTNYVAGFCRVQRPYAGTSEWGQNRAIGVEHTAMQYVREQLKQNADLPLASSVKVEKYPQHGKLDIGYSQPGNIERGDKEYWRYTPNPGYVHGNDQATFLVDVQGMPVRVVVVLKVRQQKGSDAQWAEICPPDYRVISSSADSTNLLLTWQRHAELSAMLAAASAQRMEAMDATNIAFPGHHNHFHIYLRPPVIKPLSPRPLLAESTPAGSGWGSPNSDMAGSFVQTGTTAPKPVAPSIVRRIENSYEVEPPCLGAETLGSPDSNPKFPVLSLDPQMFLANDLVRQGLRPSGPLEVTVLSGPSHGTLERAENGTGVAVLGHKKISGEVRFESNAFYGYRSHENYEGHDQITFLVTSNYTKFRVTVLIAVGPQMAPTVKNDDCKFIAPIPPRPRAAGDTESNVRVVSVGLEPGAEATDDIAAWLQQAQLSSHIADANQSLLGF